MCAIRHLFIMEALQGFVDISMCAIRHLFIMEDLQGFIDISMCAIQHLFKSKIYKALWIFQCMQ